MRQRSADAEALAHSTAFEKPPDFHATAAALAPAVLRVATALVGPADAEDAAQEAILRAWQNWETLRDPAAARAWLLRITVNVCHRWRRGAGARLREAFSFDEAQGELLAALDADPGSSDHTGALDLRFAVNHLPAPHRMMIVLRYYGGMDATEIGQALDLPPSTVRTRLSRALGMLRERLGAPPESDIGATKPTPQMKGGR